LFPSGNAMADLELRSPQGNDRIVVWCPGVHNYTGGCWVNWLLCRILRRRIFATIARRAMRVHFPSARSQTLDFPVRLVLSFIVPITNGADW
jgi:hypothetical protein